MDPDFTHTLYALVKGTGHEKPFFPGKGALGPSKYESGKKNPDQNQARGNVPRA